MAKEKKKVVSAEPEKAEVLTFTKEKIVGSKKYSKYKDYLMGNLIDGQSYTFDQVDELINKMKGKGE